MQNGEAGNEKTNRPGIDAQQMERALVRDIRVEATIVVHPRLDRPLVVLSA
jgi:hypothetical protein